jgi:signal transduction histidine kinase
LHSILGFAQLLEAGKLALALAPRPLAPVLLDCESMIEPQAQSSGIRVNFSKLDSELQVIADAVRLKQVLVNLLSNAIKYNRTDGSVDVTVRNGFLGRLRIRVHDTADGLSDEKYVRWRTESGASVCSNQWPVSRFIAPAHLSRACT